jgi:hypothetical protein
MNNSIRIVKVVTRNFVLDFISRIQNMFGANLSSYELMIEKAMVQIDKELLDNDVSLEWYRYEITQLTNGAVAVLMYGDRK